MTTAMPIEQTLPRMKIRMGLAPEMIDQHPEGKLLRASGIFPEQPLLPESVFDSIVDYYEQAAPAEPLPQAPREMIDVGLRLFRYEKPAFRTATPATTMVKINPAERRIYTGDAETQSLGIFSQDGTVLQTLSISNVPVSLTETPAGLYLTSIGRFLPSEDPKGDFTLFERATNGLRHGRVLLKDLPRPTQAEFADFNGDGKMDFVMAMFGNSVGRFSWFENLGRDQYEEHVLIPKPGAVRLVVRDFNGDGRPDLAVLIAQEMESMFVLINDGRGNFTPHLAFNQPPIYGHTYFEVADFNGDGRPDFLVTNGDNGEYASPTKRYHGIRIYTNRGDYRFDETFFYPLNGAFKAVARDFDEDGDLDIAAISFFPDYRNSPEESFVYLENQGGLKFSAATFRECISGRWLTMDAGDLDGDGDIDIVLGSYIHGPSSVPMFLMKDWEKLGPSFVILRNQLRRSK